MASHSDLEERNKRSSKLKNEKDRNPGSRHTPGVLKSLHQADLPGGHKSLSGWQTRHTHLSCPRWDGSHFPRAPGTASRSSSEPFVPHLASLVLTTAIVEIPLVVFHKNHQLYHLVTSSICKYGEIVSSSFKFIVFCFKLDCFWLVNNSLL